MFSSQNLGYSRQLRAGAILIWSFGTYKELPKEYLQKISAEEHFNEAKRQFNHLKKLIDIDHIQLKFSI